MIKLFKQLAKKQHFNLYVDPYKMDCIVFINHSGEEMNKVLKKALKSKAQMPKETVKYFNDKKLNTGYYMYNPKEGIRLIFIKSDNIYNAIGVFEHEKLHLLHNILWMAGMKLCNKSEEAYAYLFADISEQFLRCLK